MKNWIVSGVATLATLAVGLAVPLNSMASVEGVFSSLGDSQHEKLQNYIENRIIPGEIVIQSKSAMRRSQVSSLAARFNGRIMGEIEDQNLYLVKVSETADTESVITSMKSDPGVNRAFSNILFAIPEYFQAEKPSKQNPASAPSRPRPVDPPQDRGPGIHGSLSPQHTETDPLSGYQWHLAKTREAISNRTLGIENSPIIAVIDTGVSSHRDLYGEHYNKILPGFDFVNNRDYVYDDQGHGTHVAGIAAADSENSVGIHGMCPGCSILPVKVLDYRGSGSYFSIMAGVDYANKRIDELGGRTGTPGILNMSLGGYLDPNEPAYALMADLVASVAANNKVIVASAGNDNDYFYTYCQEFPEDCGGYWQTAPASMVSEQASGFGVGASNPNDYRASFSATNTKYTNIVAPGRFILSTTTNGSYEPWNGTSMAAPVVAGTVGRVWSRNASSDASDIKTRILNSATPLDESKGWAADLKRIDLTSALGWRPAGFVGYAVDTEVGDWYLGRQTGLSQPINHVQVTVRNMNNAVVAQTVTDDDGFFLVHGLQPNTSYRINYLNSSHGWYRQTVETGDQGTGLTDVPPMFMSTTRTAVPPFEEILATLEWDSVEPYTAECQAGTGSCTDQTNRGSELDFFVQRPDGEVISWLNRGNQYALYTRDSFVDFMPGEAIYIKNLMEGGTNTYTLAVNRAGWGNMRTVNAKVKIYSDGDFIDQMSAPIACGNAATDAWWMVAQINAQTGAVTPINTCQDDYPF